MRLESPAFGQGETLPVEFTAEGGNRLPTLHLSKIPEGAVSLVIVVDNPMGPGGAFAYWLIWNVPADCTVIADDCRPGGTEGINGYGLVGWGGPCPASGAGPCFFKAYALDAWLDLQPGADAADLLAAMEGHVLDQAGLLAAGAALVA